MDSFVSSLPPVTWSNLSSHLSSKTRSHLTRVYGHLVTLLGVSSVASYAFLTYARSVPLLDSPWLSLLGTLGCALSFHLTSPVKENDSKRYAFSMGFAVFQGLALGPLLRYTLYLNPSLLTMALSSTAVIFGTFSASVLLTPIPQYFYIAGFLGSLMSVLGWLQFLNFFMGSSALFSVELYLGLIAFSMFVIYDTQVMIIKSEMGSTDYMKHAMELYTDLAAIFVRILLILQKKESDKDEENERRRKRR